MGRTKHAVGTMRWNGKVWRRWTGKRWAIALYSRDRIRLTMPEPLDTDLKLSRAARDELLAAAVEDQLTTHGAYVIHVGPQGTLLGYRRPVSHSLHAVLAVVTLGAWLLVWLIMCVARTEDRLRLDVDPWGHIWATHAKSV